MLCSFHLFWLLFTVPLLPRSPLLSHLYILSSMAASFVSSTMGEVGGDGLQGRGALPLTAFGLVPIIYPSTIVLWRHSGMMQTKGYHISYLFIYTSMKAGCHPKCFGV